MVKFMPTKTYKQVKLVNIFIIRNNIPCGRACTGRRDQGGGVLHQSCSPSTRRVERAGKNLRSSQLFTSKFVLVVSFSAFNIMVQYTKFKFTAQRLHKSLLIWYNPYVPKRVWLRPVEIRAEKAYCQFSVV